MIDFINNPWVVGIGAGVLSSLVVALITKSIFSRRDNREYRRRISQANQEVLYAVRPGISEGVIPSNEVLRRIVSATARRYDLEESDLYSLNEFGSELTKEVMDSSFISAETKKEFCEELSHIAEEQPIKSHLMSSGHDQKATRYRHQMIFIMSMMVGMTTAFAGFMTSKQSLTVTDPEQLLFLIFPAVALALLVSRL